MRGICYIFSKAMSTLTTDSQLFYEGFATRKKANRMSPLEKQELIDEELAAFKQALPDCDDAPLMVLLATERLHERLFEPELTISQVKEHLGVTGNAFSARFRRYHGRTPKGYARQLRVRAAKALLYHDELAATSVALAVGYEHYRSFARVFKRRAGCSPSVFRGKLHE